MDCVGFELEWIGCEYGLDMCNIGRETAYWSTLPAGRGGEGGIFIKYHRIIGRLVTLCRIGRQRPTSPDRNAQTKKPYSSLLSPSIHNTYHHGTRGVRGGCGAKAKGGRGGAKCSFEKKRAPNSPGRGGPKPGWVNCSIGSDGGASVPASDKVRLCS